MYAIDYFEDPEGFTSRVDPILKTKRHQVVNALSFLLATRPLLEAGILHLVENLPTIDFCIRNEKSWPLKSGITYDKEMIINNGDFSAIGSLDDLEKSLQFMAQIQRFHRHFFTTHYNPTALIFTLPAHFTTMY